jgi:transcriptional regulator with XRE-family HTH domain
MNYLRIQREARGWSHAELARRASLHASTISLLESGRLVAYPSQVAKLAAALELPELRAAALLTEVNSHDPEDA